MKAKTGRGLKTIALWVNRIAAVILVICMVLLTVSSIIEIHGEKKIYRYYKTPIERANRSFEDTELFSGILKDQIADISRMCVIRNQMESNGVYNGRKIIDISSFANRDDILADEKVTAKYFLDDLIKWGNYGFDYETIGNRTQLYNRYETIEGKYLEDYASTNEEYKTLVTNLQIAASELFQNYTEYTKYQKKYADGETNIVFCYAFTENGVTSYYTNMKNPIKGMSVDDITSLFSKYNRFIAYNPEKMQITTNTGLNAQDMRSILTQYEYSFQDDSRIWIGIHDSYANDDVLSRAYLAYSDKEPYFVLWLFGAVLAFVSFVVSTVAMTKMELKVVYEGKGAKRIEKQRRLWLEVYLLLCVAGICGVVFIIREFMAYLPGEENTRYTLTYAMGGFAFLFHVLFSWLYICGIQKIRGGTIHRHSLVW